MKECPNIDKNTLNVLKKMGVNYSPKNRAVIFYTVCIILRLFIAGLVYQFRYKKWLPYLFIIPCILVIYNISTNTYGRWWWSRPFHLLICILLFIVSIMVITGDISGKYLSYLLYLDVLVGFIHSLFITRC